MEEFIPKRESKRGAKLTQKIRDAILHDRIHVGLTRRGVAAKYNVTEATVRNVILDYQKSTMFTPDEAEKPAIPEDIFNNAIQYINIRIATDVIKLRMNKGYRPKIDTKDVIRIIEVIAPYLKAKVDPKAKKEEPKKAAFRGLTLKPNATAI